MERLTPNGSGPRLRGRTGWIGRRSPIWRCGEPGWARPELRFRGPIRGLKRRIDAVLPCWEGRAVERRRAPNLCSDRAPRQEDCHRSFVLQCGPPAEPGESPRLSNMRPARGLDHPKRVVADACKGAMIPIGGIGGLAGRERAGMSAWLMRMQQRRQRERVRVRSPVYGLGCMGMMRGDCALVASH